MGPSFVFTGPHATVQIFEQQTQQVFDPIGSRSKFTDTVALLRGLVLTAEPSRFFVQFARYNPGASYAPW